MFVYSERFFGGCITDGLAVLGGDAKHDKVVDFTS